MGFINDEIGSEAPLGFSHGEVSDSVVESTFEVIDLKGAGGMTDGWDIFFNHGLIIQERTRPCPDYFI